MAVSIMGALGQQSSTEVLHLGKTATRSRVSDGWVEGAKITMAGRMGILNLALVGLVEEGRAITAGRMGTLKVGRVGSVAVKTEVLRQVSADQAVKILKDQSRRRHLGGYNLSLGIRIRTTQMPIILIQITQA
jgi:hypothetical protein